jgi:UDP:flavonoid glycosyltransferase YjiC (YdhE family)
MKILIGVDSNSLGEITKIVKLIDIIKENNIIHLFFYNGQYVNLLKSLPYKYIFNNKYSVDEEKTLLKIHHGEQTMRAVKNKIDFTGRIKNEISFLTSNKYDIVIIGWCLSLLISCRITNIKIINILHSTFLTSYYKQKKINMPDQLNIFFIKILPFFIRYKIASFLELYFSYSKPHISLFKNHEYKISNYNYFFEGDFTFIADIPTYANLDNLGGKKYFIGPLIKDLSEKKVFYFKNKKTAYVVLGSSGTYNVLIKVLDILLSLGYFIYASFPNPSALPLCYRINERIHFQTLLNSSFYISNSNIVIINGGHNSIMTACYYKKPFIGIAFHVEQERNLDLCVNKGFAYRLKKNKINLLQVQYAIEKTNQADMHEKIISFQKEIKDFTKNISIKDILNKIHHYNYGIESSK